IPRKAATFRGSSSSASLNKDWALRRAPLWLSASAASASRVASSASRRTLTSISICSALASARTILIRGPRYSRRRSIIVSWSPLAASRKAKPSASPTWSSRRMIRRDVLRPRAAPRTVPSDALIGVEKLAVLVKREPVCHPGDIVGNHPRQRLAVGLDAAQDMVGQLVRIAHVSVEQGFEHPRRLAGHPAHPVVPVQALAHQLLELLDHRRHRGAEAGKRAAGAPHVVHALDCRTSELGVDV